MSKIEDLYENNIVSIAESGGRVQFMEACDHHYTLEYTKAEMQQLIDELQKLTDTL